MNDHDRTPGFDLRYTGSRQQLMRLRTFRCEGGRAQGMLACEAQSGALLLTVAADRCMDIYELMYRGVNVGFINKMGLCAPQFYDPAGAEFQYSFTAGFMSTCGLTHFGSSCTDAGQELGQHGRIGACPAEHFCVRYKNGEPGAVISGEMVQGRLFAENYRLCRTYDIRPDESFTVTDAISNDSPREQPFQLLYHVNFGYPFLSPACRLLLPSREITPRTPYSAQRLEHALDVEPACDNAADTCYYHTLGRKNGRSMAGIFNPELGFGVIYDFDAGVLDNFIQWKNPCSGEYILGMEPCNSIVTGRAEARRLGKLKFMQPYETITHSINFRFFDASELPVILKELEEYK